MAKIVYAKYVFVTFQMINLSERRNDMHKLNDNVSVLLFCIILSSGSLFISAASCQVL